MRTRIPAILAATLVAALTPTAIADAKQMSGSNAAEALTGTEGPDRIAGNGGADRIRALGGDDDVTGDTGPDDLGGGAGNDRLDGGSGDDIIAGDDGNDVGIGGFGHDTLTGGVGDDSMDGGPAPDRVEGGDGNDTLHGGSGGDDIYGGPGNDTIYFDSGPDHIFGEDGDDVIYVNGDSLVDDVDCGNGADTLYVAPRATNWGRATAARIRDGLIVNCENVVELAPTVDPLKGISASIPNSGGSKTGTELNDNLRGQHGSDKIIGLGGDDVIWGDQNHDTTAASKQAQDQLDGGAGNDTITAIIARGKA